MGIFIKKLTIKNFKCFESKSFDFNAPDSTNEGSGLNILVGENGNGKTTVLEAINYLTLNSYSAENKLKINDFNDWEEPITVTAETEKFSCKSSIDFYSKWSFESSGVEFIAKNRDTKAANKLLSSPFQINNNFLTVGNYIKPDGSAARAIDGRDKVFDNSRIIGTEGVNIFYFDKNRTRQLSNGTFKTTFQKICDDLSWKFLREINGDQSKQDLLNKNITGDYFKNLSDMTQKEFGQDLAKEMKDFFGNEEYKNLKLDVINILRPFTNGFFALREDDDLSQIDIKDLGSGIEMILSLLLLRRIADNSKGSIIYLIDEPELHLHPKAQEKLIQLLVQESKDKQILISTHSPYIFKNCLANNTGVYMFNRDDSGDIQIQSARDGNWGLFPWSPSWGEINHFTFDLTTVEFHNELYGYLQEKSGKNHIQDFDEYLKNDKGVTNIKTYKQGPNDYDITICTYIRNQIHHPENTDNSKFTDQDLKKSTELLIEILQRDK